MYVYNIDTNIYVYCILYIVCAIIISPSLVAAIGHAKKLPSVVDFWCHQSDVQKGGGLPKTFSFPLNMDLKHKYGLAFPVVAPSPPWNTLYL